MEDTREMEGRTPPLDGGTVGTARAVADDGGTAALREMLELVRLQARSIREALLETAPRRPSSAASFFPTLGSTGPRARADDDGDRPAYGIIDPDYARVYTQARIIAWQYGFACLMQGSFTRDLDLLLVPWEDRACDGVVVPILRQIAASCGLQMYVEHGEPRVTRKPHGRMAYTLHFPGLHDRRWVDVSVVPCRRADDEGSRPAPTASQSGAALKGTT